MGFLALFKNIAVHAGLGALGLFSLLGFGTPPQAFPQKTAPAFVVPLVPTPLKQASSSFPKVADAETTPKNQDTAPEGPEAEAQAAPVARQKAPATEQAAVEPATLNDRARQAVVNILCRAGSGVQSISGSGVLIDPRGIILTNAHVAQFFLLTDYPTEGNVRCVIRTGSPARPSYGAELLYISPEWIRENAHDLAEQNPSGTGENDYAFVRITESVKRETPLPEKFPFLSFDTANEQDIGENVLLTGYPAGFLGSFEIESNLHAVSSLATIGGIYTFGTNTPDLVSVGGSAVAQKGSSGGAVIEMATGKLISLVVTSTEAATTGERDLRAITLSHIERSLLRSQGLTIGKLLEGDAAQMAQDFRITVAPTLTKILTNVLESR